MWAVKTQVNKLLANLSLLEFCWDPTFTVTDMVLLPDACTLLLGHRPSSHQQETAPCTGRQIRAARGYHMMNNII